MGQDMLAVEAYEHPETIPYKTHKNAIPCTATAEPYDRTQRQHEASRPLHTAAPPCVTYSNAGPSAERRADLSLSKSTGLLRGLHAALSRLCASASALLRSAVPGNIL